MPSHPRETSPSPVQKSARVRLSLLTSLSLSCSSFLWQNRLRKTDCEDQKNESCWKEKQKQNITKYKVWYKIKMKEIKRQQKENDKKLSSPLHNNDIINILSTINATNLTTSTTHEVAAPTNNVNSTLKRQWHFSKWTYRSLVWDSYLHEKYKTQHNKLTTNWKQNIQMVRKIPWDQKSLQRHASGADKQLPEGQHTCLSTKVGQVIFFAFLLCHKHDLAQNRQHECIRPRATLETGLPTQWLVGAIRDIRVSSRETFHARHWSIR